MTDAAIADYCRADYTKADIIRPSFDKIVERAEATQPRTFKEIIRILEGLNP